MLYNKSAVKNRKPVTKKQIELARKAPLFKLNKKTLDSLKERITPVNKDIYSYMGSISDWIGININYDYSHKFN